MSDSQSNCSPKLSSEAVRRADVLRPLLELKGERGRLSPGIKAAAAELGVSYTTVWRWLGKLESDGRALALTSGSTGPRRGTRKLDSEVEQIIELEIQRTWLKPERPSFARLYRSIEASCRDADLKPPNWRTVKNRVMTLDPKLALQKREGTSKARQKLRPVTKTFSASRPLEYVQIDHTLVDVILVDEIDRAPLKRPWLTVALDICTRCVAGFYLSLDPPSSTSVALCLTRAVFDKSKWLNDLGISIDWPIRGIPEKIHVDNATEFHSRTFTTACRDWGIKVVWRPVGRPEYGGHVERLIGTTMGAVHVLPGTTFSSVAERGDYDSAAKATMTMAELERWIALEIGGRYHNDIHKSLDRPPLAVWNELEDRARWRMPESPEAFLLSFLPDERRKLRRDGVNLFRIKYWSDALTADLGHAVEPMMVKYDPRDLSRIWVQRLAGNFVEARYRDLSRPPISIWEHRAAVRRLRAQGKREVREDEIFAAIKEQRQIEDDAKRSSTQARRAAARRPKAPSDTPRNQNEETYKLPSIDTSKTDLPTYPVEIWDE